MSINFVPFRTDPATDFTAALATNAALFFDAVVPGVGEGPFIIQSLEVVSKQQLAWEFWFFSRKMTAIPAEPVDDYFRGRWGFQAADGVQIGATGLYHYSIDGLLIPTECNDYRDHVPTYGQLHMALVNRSVASKSAGAAGNLVVNVIMGGAF